MVEAGLLVGLTTVLLLLCLLAFGSFGVARLESGIAIRRDGLQPGTCAPGWRLPDVRGTVRESPSPSGRTQAALAEAVAGALAPSVPVVEVGEELYRRYRVRVMPYATVVADGRVQTADLVEHGDYLHSLLRRASLLPAEPSGPPCPAANPG